MGNSKTADESFELLLSCVLRSFFFFQIPYSCMNTADMKKPRTNDFSGAEN